MAISSVPSNFLSPLSTTSPTQSLFFHKFLPQTSTFKTLREPSKLKISCCQQTVQFDNETNQNTNLVKKKRKLRPSFLEQVQNKWSLKVPSLRENFPWQEQQETGTTNQEEFQAQVAQGSGRSTSASGPVSFRTKVKSNLAPWIHGNQSSTEAPNSEGETKYLESVRRNDQGKYLESVRRNDQGKYLESVRRNDQGFDDFLEHCRNNGSGTLVKGITSDGKSERKYDEIEKIPIRLHEKNEKLGPEESKSVIDVDNIKSSVDANDRERLPWESKADEEFEKNDKLRSSNTELAERLIPEHELKRLRNVSLKMVERIKIGAAGVTQALVDAIHEKWKLEEVVKLKFEGPPSKNMKRTHEILESRTGGLVIRRSGSSVVLYRGLTYKLDCVKSYSKQADIGPSGSSHEESSKSTKHKILNEATGSSGLHSSTYFKNLSEEEQMNLSEINLLLDELGPRFIDWSGCGPLPVDADLLPAVIPGFKTPFRLLPHGTRQALRDKEMTYLRRTARTIPPHFALGRSRELQGLALAMVKLWEKSAIAKIAIKRGVQNTSNERMAEELKILTGGTLLSRNKEFIVFYRGNDFMPPHVSSALIEAERRTTLEQDKEEQARHRAAAALIDPKAKASNQPLVAGTLAETVAATSRWGNQPNTAEMEKMMIDATIARHASLVKCLQKKLALAREKMRKAEKALQKVLENQEPEDLPTDLETLSDEERFLFRKIGLSMKPYLVLGRREIFDGTIENMHLHWKYRELVKILVERKTFAQVKHIALSLEAESGGVLVSVEKTIKGYVIIVYRGKNYQSPLACRPKNLLTRRQALARSIELQRREALNHHILELEQKIEKLKEKLDEMMSENNQGEETLDSRTNAASV